MADPSRACGVVTGDGLLVSLSSAAASKLGKLEVQHVALVYRSFCSLHGIDSDEYRAQRGPRFQLEEPMLAEQFQQGGAADSTNSDSASESAASSAQHAQPKKSLNTNFFCLNADDRPLVDTVVQSNASLLSIETSERTIECCPMVLPSQQATSPISLVTDSAQDVVFLVSCS